MAELTRQLNQKDTELVNQDIEATKRELILSTMVSEIGFSEVPEKCLSK
jgi:hypothetical protein